MRRRAGATLLLAAAASWSSAAAASPGNDYMLQCQGCHRADGSGFGEAVPDLRDRVGLFLEVPGGREFLVRVPGSAQSPLSDAELAAVLNWMVARFGPPEVAREFTPFTAGEVRESRRPLADVASAREALVQHIEARRAAAAR